ncbi:glycosyltransferase family 10 [Neolewinella lacunae]|uniref:Alpha-(1,3)-fucosyltransferase FucT N-terminal domain-containing protein n=1 Tax=Neolewinella lacunae TaxID=1517758 RepID=A0A923TAV3_9BACT|nr:glycosyltransferase family 10 [Neolewinella lacunae]MBC6996583.1 hypothetical protein [Neolewinella lacunae]MDN3634853.1 glycosyltransferase family 10 [Neolewinella lacunae]
MKPRGRAIIRAAKQWTKDGLAVARGLQQAQRYGVGYYNFWDLGPVEHSWFYRFLQRPALAALARRRKVGFYSVFGRRRLIGWGRERRKVFFTGENLAHYPAYHDHALGEVELALGFEYLDHPHYLRFPLWMLDQFDPTADYPGLKSQLSVYERAGEDVSARPGFASLVARHDNNGIRGAIGDVAATLGPVNYPGAFRCNQEKGLAEGNAAKLAHLRNYRYNLCPENSNAAGYVTEKVFHAIAAGCIPVYWGADNVPEPEVLRQEAILFYDPARPLALREALEELERKPAALAAFARQPRFQPTAAGFLHQQYLALEKQLLRVLRG